MHIWETLDLLSVFVDHTGGHGHDSATAGSQYGSVMSATEPGSGGGGSYGGSGGSHVTINVAEVIMVYGLAIAFLQAVF